MTEAQNAHSNQNSNSSETIYALASGQGLAGVAVVRISGAEAGKALIQLIQKPLPRSRLATLYRLYHPRTKEPLDQALVLWFVGPASFTGEDVVELHIHGGPAVIDSVLSALGEIKGLRQAEPGAFTRRAFEHGKMDLTQVEGLADLIHAQTEAQRKQALRQSDGELGALYGRWRSQLIQALAHFEAELDFSDEELPTDIRKKINDNVQHLYAAIQTHLEDGRGGERLRNGVRVAIIGPPNAGKSSLLNVLALRQAAIVSDVPGTTRDVVEVHLNLGGFPVLVADTAGLRDGADAIEREGVRRAKAWAADADIKLALFDGLGDPLFDLETLACLDDRTLVVVNKIDQMDPTVDNFDDMHIVSEYSVLPISVKRGDGMDALVDQLTVRVKACCRGCLEGPVPTRARHRDSLVRTAKALFRFLNPQEFLNLQDLNSQEMTGVENADGMELGVEDLRLAARELGRITGRVDVEDLLDVIFKDFCIGK